MTAHVPRSRAADPDRSAVLALLAAIAVGVAIRLLVARSPGFPSDVGTFMAWAERMAAIGPGGFYEPGYFSDYPPGFLYVLWAVGALFDGDALRAVVKLLSVPFDVGIALLLFAVVRRHAGAATGAFAGALWILQPGPIFAGPFWGQVDAAGTLPLLAAVVAAGHGRWVLAGVLAAAAAMVKPQFGVVALPLAFAAAFELARRADARPVLGFGAAGLATVGALALPFRLGVGDFAELLRGASETYPYTSLFAFNIWSVVADFWKPDDAYVVTGALLLLGGIAGAIAPLWWRRDLAVLLVAVGLAAMAFYFLPTRAHERYIYPAFALLLPFAALRARILVPYLLLAATFFATLFFAFSRYPQNDLVAPDWLELTLFSRPGQIAMALAMMAGAGLLALRLLRGEGRLAPTLEVVAEAPPATARPWTLPAGLGLGRAPTARDLMVALLIALAVVATRGYRLDHPRDMYFDEVYHARTAFELLAQREPYEWTHPHLAKEAMALGILAFGGDRVVAREGAPPDATAFAVSNEGLRAYGFADGFVSLPPRPQQAAPFVRLIDGGVVRGSHLDGPVLALGFDGERVVAVTDRSVYFDALDAARLPLADGPPTSFAISEGRAVVGTARGVYVYGPLGGEPLVVPIPVAALTARPGSNEIYVADPEGAVRVVDAATGAEAGQPLLGGARASAIAYARGAGKIYTARADEPAIDWYEAPGADASGRHIGRIALSNGRTGDLTGGVTALALVPRTQFLYALADGHAVVIEAHGASPFAAIPVAGSMLGVDGAGDRLLVLGEGGIESIETGRHAFAWRLPGVLFAAILAFFVVLLARRLFASGLVPVFAGIAVVLEGSMFAQARIGMNDIYVATLIVVGWYFVVAAHRPRRRAWLDLALAGAALGLAAAAKWAAFYAIAGVGLASIAVTAWAWRRHEAGSGGPLDLLAGRGLNLALLAACFGALPLAVYLGSYIPWFGGPTAPYDWSLVDLTKQMYWYHSGLTAPHPAGSPWWSWPLVLKPVYWYLGSPGPGLTAVIYDAGNIVLFWGALAASVWAAVTAVRTRSLALGVLLLAMLAQYVAWIPISRVLFFYHFFTALPFYLLILAAALAALWERGRSRLVGGYLAMAAAAFVFFYPFISGQPVGAESAGMFYVLPTWQYDCQFYPALVCAVSFPSSVPFGAVLAQVGLAALAGVIAAGLFALSHGSARERLRALVVRR